MSSSAARVPAPPPPPAPTPRGVRQRVAGYYDSLQLPYSLLWSRRGIHYGLWEDGVRRHADAIRNMDRVVAGALGLPSGSRVLDAGCGVGGTSLLLAAEWHFRMIGVTISEVQLRRARRAARRLDAPSPPAFIKADYSCTGFADGSFDGVIGVESICYAEPKLAFLREAYRVLRPGGRLVVADGFWLRRDLSAREARARERFLRGWALGDVAHVDDFAADLRRAGFDDLRWESKHEAVLPSAARIRLLTGAAVVLGSPLFALRLLPRRWLAHGVAGVVQHRLFRDRVLTYGMFAARKPG